MNNYFVVKIRSVEELRNYLKSKNYTKPMSSTLKDVKFDPEKIKKLSNLLNSFPNKTEGLIWSDYDNDGLAGGYNTELGLTSFPNVNATTYFPNRFTDAYGAYLSAIKRCIREKKKFLILVDNGSNITPEAIKLAKENDIKVIILDHHQINGDKEPDVDVFINPHYTKSTLKNKEICAGALTFYVFRQLGTPDEIAKKMLYNAFISTVSDCQTLEWENRKIVDWGIKNTRSNACPLFGIRYVYQNINNFDITEFNLSSVQFGIAPLLNSSGRMDDPIYSYKLLSCNNTRTVSTIYKKVEDFNQHRKNLVDKLFKNLSVKQNIINVGFVESKNVRLDGVIGLLASEYVKATNMPAACFTNANGVIKGSVRSIENVDILSIFKPFLANNPDCLSYGGHKGAMGISFKSMEGFVKFKKTIEALKIDIPASETIEVLMLDGVTDNEALGLMNSLEIFDAERPLFYMDKKIIGAYNLADKHTQLKFSDTEFYPWFFHIKDGNEFGKENIVYELGGSSKVTIRVRDAY